MRLELRDVRHVYALGAPFEVAALRGVSLVVEPGEILVIVGGTGSGKSTLIQHLNLLLEPTSGEVLVDGVDARTLNRGELRRRVGLVFQFPEAALFAPTVAEDVAFAPRRMGLSEDEVESRALNALRTLGIEHLAQRSPFSLSGGEKRRVAISGVLAMRPEVLVLDEPTAGLDPRGRRELLELLRRLADDRDLTLVVCSASLSDASLLCDRVVVLGEGRVVMDGPLREVLREADRLAELDITLPEPTAGALELREIFPDLPPDVLTEEELEAEILERLGAA